MKPFRIGDKVAVLDDITEGKVTAVTDNTITVETSDGFLLQYAPSELVLIASDEIQVTNYQVAQIKSEKQNPKRRKTQTVKPKERNAPKMEVDLHIHHLTKNNKGMSNYDMLTIQLDTAKKQLDFAIRKRIQKVVFIHGVGEGVLKEELYYLFNRYDNLKYYDADYQKYGLGATEVYIYQNVN